MSYMAWQIVSEEDSAPPFDSETSSRLRRPYSWTHIHLCLRAMLTGQIKARKHLILAT